MAARVRTRIEGLERDVLSFIDPDLSEDGRAEFRARIAREQLADAQAVNQSVLGRIPNHETFVDGRAEAPLETVQPNGVIVFEFELLGDVLIWIYQMLMKHSPRLRGDYQTSHLLFADDAEVADIEKAPPAAEYVFLNEQPYARKIERGLSPQAPDGVYEAVAALANGRFGNLVRVSYGFREFRGGPLMKWAELRRPSKTGYSRSKRQSAMGRDTRQPAIIVQTQR